MQVESVGDLSSKLDTNVVSSDLKAYGDMQALSKPIDKDVSALHSVLNEEIVQEGMVLEIQD